MPPSLLRALQRVLSPAGYPYGSNGRLFREACFGRDALEVAEDLLAVRPAVARCVIRSLATLQGRRLDLRSEEEPGKIHHEHRALVMDGRPVGDEARRIFRLLIEHWKLGDDLTELTNYCTVDATPLYVRLVSEYCRLYGTDLLCKEYSPRGQLEEASRLTIRESVRRAMTWIADRITRSDVGLLEFQRMTPRGHRFQAWKDGATSYLHPDGHLANCDAPIASIEVQGLTYDALMAAPALLPDAPPQRRDGWIALARQLQRATLHRFWMPDERYFAMALDRDPGTGHPRQVKLITSNPGALLDSGLFDTLPPTERQTLLMAIVERVFSDELLTPVGIRCTSLVHKDVLDYPAYQSSYTVWHKETYDIAKGLRRQGFIRLAEDLENRLLNAINLAGGPTEFLYVFPDNRAQFDPLINAPGEKAEEIAATNVPENDQAWTISAALAIKWRRGRRRTARPVEGTWQSELEDEIFGRIERARLLRTIREIKSAFPTSYSFWVNREKGFARERAYLARFEP